MNTIKVEVEVRTTGYEPQQLRDLARRLENHARGVVTDYLSIVGNVSPDGSTFFVDSSRKVEEDQG